MQTQTDLRYPVGKYEPRPYSEELKEHWLADIRFLPNAIENAVHNLDEQQLQTPYREGGWTVHQLVHHIADSHMNAYMRLRLGLTENNPTIKPYDQDAWALLNDVKILPINVSLTLLHALHQRLFAMLKDLSESEWERTGFHPDHKKKISLWELLGMYAWHGKHHVAHIKNLREKKNW
jgi:hypothetical protein